MKNPGESPGTSGFLAFPHAISIQSGVVVIGIAVEEALRAKQNHFVTEAKAISAKYFCNRAWVWFDDVSQFFFVFTSHLSSPCSRW
jgi:hypothetical protein